MEDYKKIHFKIKRVDENYYIIRQRHTLLFIFHFYDDGAEILCPYYRTEKEYQAQDRIEGDEVPEAFKLKSLAFLEQEKKAIDKGEVDMEMQVNSEEGAQ